MTETMKKKEIDLRKIFEKLRIVPEEKLDYAAGVIEGMSIAYSDMIDLKRAEATPVKSA